MVFIDFLFRESSLTKHLYHSVILGDLFWNENHPFFRSKSVAPAARLRWPLWRGRSWKRVTMIEPRFPARATLALDLQKWFVFGCFLNLHNLSNVSQIWIFWLHTMQIYIYIYYIPCVYIYMHNMHVETSHNHHRSGFRNWGRVFYPFLNFLCWNHAGRRFLVQICPIINFSLW